MPKRGKVRRVATKFYLVYLYRRGEGKQSIKPSEKRRAREALKENKESVSQPRFGFGSRLRKGKVLAPLTSMVLHGNHLGCFTYMGFIYYCFIFKRMCERKGLFLLLQCSPRIGALVPTYHSFGDEESELRSSEQKMFVCWLILPLKEGFSG